MSNHPIEGLMNTAMSNIKAMVDVNTIVGDAVTAPDNTLIIPISTVSFGFAAGGSEFSNNKQNTLDTMNTPMFGGGSGGGANVKPIAFLVVSNGNVRLLPVTNTTGTAEKIIDLVPEMVDKLNSIITNAKSKKKEKTSDDSTTDDNN